MITVVYSNKQEVHTKLNYNILILY